MQERPGSMAGRPSLEQLRVLVAVAEAGTFSAAARALGRAQPAVSHSIHQLETTLGVELFDRGGKIAKLTAAGRTIVGYAQRTLEAVELLADHADQLASRVEIELDFAVDGGIARHVVLEAARVVSEAYPHLMLNIFTEGVGGSEELLRQGVVQLAFYAPSHASGKKGLASQPVGFVSAVPVVASSHPLASERGPLTREVLSRHCHLVMTDRLKAMEPASGVSATRWRWMFSDVATFYGALRAGFGWGHMPLQVVSGAISRGELQRLQLAEGVLRLPGAEIHAVHEPGRPPGPAGLLLIRAMKDSLAVD